MRKILIMALCILQAGARLSSQELIPISGIVRDIYTGETLPGAHVSLEGTSSGVAANSEGGFLFRVAIAPDDTRNICISFIGYEKSCLPVTAFTPNMVVRLKPMSGSVGEVTVRGTVRQSATEILGRAARQVITNYELSPVGLKGFYRETTEENRQVVSIAEAAVTVWKSPYNQVEVADQIRVEKARSVSGEKSFAYADFSSVGGPYYRLRDDIVRHKVSFLQPDDFRYYDYKLVREIGEGDDRIFVISFKPIQLHTSASSNFTIYKQTLKYDNTTPLYEGEVFVRAADYAVVKAIYRVPNDKLNYAMPWFFDKTPSNTRVYLRDAIFEAEYRNHAGKWFLSHTKGTIHFSLSNRTTLSTLNYKVVNELLISDRISGEIARFAESDTERSFNLLSERMTRYDEDFWKEFNIVKATGDLLKFGEAPGSSVVFSDLVETKLNLYNRMKPYENLFVQTDRNRYYQGDTIRFSIWCNEAATGYPGFISSMVSVTLSTPEEVRADSAIIRLNEGRGSGYLIVPLGLEDGVYRFSAVTAGMLNFSDSRFFSQYLRVGSIPEAGITSESQVADFSPDATVASQPSKSVGLTVLPEGGAFVSGLESVAGVVAISTTGEPIAVTALLRDQRNVIIDTVITDKYGVGRMVLTPMIGYQYRLSVIQPAGYEGSCQLPEPLKEGISLTYRGEGEDSFNFVIRTNSKSNEKYSLIATNAGRVIWSNEFVLYGSALKAIDERFIPGGITTVTLFDISGQPLAERLIFRAEGSILNLNTAINATKLQPGRRVELTFVITDENMMPSSATMALSVADAARGFDRSLTIPAAAGVLLSGYSLDEKTPPAIPEAIAAAMLLQEGDLAQFADNVMLTWGWRRYKWNELLKSDPYDYPEVVDFSLLRGRMVNQRNRPVKDEMVKGTGTYDLRNYTFRTDEDGYFDINPTLLNASTHDLLLAPGKANRMDVWRVRMEEQPYFGRYLNRRTETMRFPQAKPVRDTTARNVINDHGGRVIPIDEVLVKGRADTASRVAGYNQILGAGFIVERSGHEIDGAMSFLELVFRVRVPVWQRGYQMSFDPFPQGFSRQGLNPDPCLFVLDGYPVGKSWESLQGMTYLDVKRIAYIPFNIAFPLYGGDAIGGVILIESHSAASGGKPGFVFTSKGPSSLRISRRDVEFFSPRYSSVPTVSQLDNDRRVTLYWNPQINVDDTGIATVTFYTDGMVGEKVITINGTGRNGRPFSGTAGFEVTERR
jgi:hypothetical protein